MLRDIQVSEARRRLPSLLREIRQDPDVGYRILVRDQVVAELRRPTPSGARMNAGAALLKAAEKIARSMRTSPRRAARAAEVTSQNYKEFLYGNWRTSGSRKRR